MWWSPQFSNNLYIYVCIILVTHTYVVTFVNQEVLTLTAEYSTIKKTSRPILRLKTVENWGCLLTANSQWKLMWCSNTAVRHRKWNEQKFLVVCQLFEIKCYLWILGK